MNLQKLFAVLAKQERNLKSLINIGEEKKEVLIANNHDQLHNVIAKEEQMLLTIQLTEEDRLVVMRDLFREFSIDNKRYKLEILIESLKERINHQIIKAISDSEKRIKTLIKKITVINELNMLLIEQSRSLINETIKAVISASTKSIVDRKG
jgi:hypothetical protein